MVEGLGGGMENGGGRHLTGTEGAECFQGGLDHRRDFEKLC